MEPFHKLTRVKQVVTPSYATSTALAALPKEAQKVTSMSPFLMNVKTKSTFALAGLPLCNQTLVQQL